MRFKKFLSIVCASAMLFFSIFCCKAMLEGDGFDCRVCFIGDFQTGKTSICKRLIGESVNKDEDSVIGARYFCVDQNDINFQIWDTAGQEHFHTLLPLYLRGAKIVGIFLDVSQNDYTKKLDHWLDLVNENSPNSEKIIVLNKTDLPGVANNVETAKQEIHDQTGIDLSQIISCSANADAGIKDLKNCMFKLAQQVRQEELRQQEQHQEQLRQQEEQRQKRRKNLTIGSLVTAGIVAIEYSVRAVYKRLTSNDKNKNVNADKLKKNYKQTKVTA